jgi:hypothetical protein
LPAPTGAAASKVGNKGCRLYSAATFCRFASNTMQSRMLPSYACEFLPMREPTGTNATEACSPGPAGEAGIEFDLGVHLEEGITTDAASRFGWIFRVRRGRGVRLAGDRICWRMGDQDNEVRLDDVASIRLLHNRGLFICRVRFKQGLLLSIHGPDPPRRQAAAYRDFVQRLHATLDPDERASIQFIKGTTEAGYWVAAVAVPFLWLLFAVAVITGKSAPGVSSALSRASRALGPNEPGTYDPAAIPQELLPDVASAPAAAAFPQSGGDPIVSPDLRQSAAGAHLEQMPRPIGSSSVPPGPPAAAAGKDRSLSALPAIFRSRRVGWSALAAMVIGFTAAAVWAAGVRETEKMFQPGEVQRVLEMVDQRSRPKPLFVHAIKITPRVLTVTAIDPDRQRWQRWRVSHAVLYNGWQEWDRVSGPEPTGSGIVGLSSVYLTSDEARLIGEIVLNALAGAALEGTEATINMQHDIEGKTDWDAASRRWVARPRQWVVEVSDARGDTRRSFATDPTPPIPER